MGVGVGQAAWVDDMVVGGKVEDKDRDENKNTAEEEKEEDDNVKEDETKEAKEEEEDKDDKENEGTGDTAAREAELELSRLKELVPSVCVKDNVSQLDVILEAIRYISSLQGKLADRIEAGDVVPVLVNNS